MPLDGYRIFIVPEESVERDPFLVPLDAVHLEELVFPTRPEIVIEAPACNSQVGPAIRDTKRAEIHMTGWAAVRRNDRVR